ncbi:MAG TPA: EamA family transporter [Candidatus Saccharimonadales bacterium]|nr:EamA family transporter [Candidatus Saccharimonadales bacterium]
MTATLLALLTFVGWGLGDIFAAVSSRRLGAIHSSIIITAFLVVVLGVFAPFMDTSGLTTTVMLQSSALGVALGIGFLAFVQALRIGNPALVGTIAGSYTGPAVILSVVFLDEVLSAGQVFFITVTIIGVIGASLDIRGLRKRSVKLDRSVAFSLVALCSWGIYFTFMKIPIGEAGWYWPSLIGTFSSLCLYLGVYFVIKRPSDARIPLRRGFLPALGNALIGGGGTVMYNVALSYGNVSVVAPIAGSYLVLFVILASLVFKEPLSRQQTAGIAISLCGIVGISMLSS